MRVLGKEALIRVINVEVLLAVTFKLYAVKVVQNSPRGCGSQPTQQKQRRGDGGPGDV